VRIGTLLFEYTNTKYMSKEEIKKKEEEKKSVFNTLFAVGCESYTEVKQGLKYLSWAFAWGEVKKKYPDAEYKIYEREDGVPYFTDGNTCWVKTSVTINDLEHIEYLPIMDNRNKSIPLANITSMDINKAIQRSITKACARHGLGLYIYAGEDLPDVLVSEIEETLQSITSLDKLEEYRLSLEGNAEPMKEKFNLKRNELAAELCGKIKKCKTTDELGALYKTMSDNFWKSNADILNFVKKKKEELNGK